MANNVKLKDLYGKTQTYSGVDVVYLPDADDEKGVKVYTERKSRQYKLRNVPTVEPTFSGGFISDAEPGAIMEYPAGSGSYVGLFDDQNIIGFVAPPDEEAGTAHSVIRVTTFNPANTLLYTYEDISSENLNKLPLFMTTTGTFTVTPGWSKAVFNANGEITLFEHLDDVSNIVFDVKFPTTTFVDDVVNAVMHEASQETKTVTVTQNGASSIVPTEGKSGIAQLNLNVNVPQSELQEKSVTITQNGTTEVVPDAGYDGMSKLTAVVNVEGGGGGVQANWAQNDSAASDYVKNRPGAYYDTIPAKTYSFDGNLTGKTYNADIKLVLVSSDVITKDALSSATYTRVVNGESTTTAVTDVQDVAGVLVVGDMSTDDLYVVVITTDEASTILGLAKGIWFDCNADATAYTSSLTVPPSTVVVELPQELTEAKQADWTVSDGSKSVLNRIGGFFRFDLNGLEITFNGDTTGKNVINVETAYDDEGNLKRKTDLVQILDYPLTKTQLMNAVESSIVYQLGETEVTSGITIEGATYMGPAFLAAYGLRCEIPTSASSSIIAPVLVSSFLKYPGAQSGTYILMTTKADGSTNYLKQVSISSTIEDKYPNDLVEPPELLNKLSIGASGDNTKKIKFLVDGTFPFIILPSNVSGSKKQFKIWVDDTGTLHTSEYTEVTN